MKIKKDQHVGFRISKEAYDNFKKLAVKVSNNERIGKKLFFEMFERIEDDDFNELVDMVKRYDLSR